MRILGHIEHSSLKITVFKMDNRISVKFENPWYEQTYKFRQDEHLNDLADVQRLVDPAFIADIAQNMQQMHQTRHAAENRFFPTTEEDEFEQII